MLLMILEPLVVNDENLDMMIKTGSVETVSRMLLLQRLSVDVTTSENGIVKKPTGDPSLVSYSHILQDERFLDAKGKIITMKSFRYILRIMASCARDPSVIGMYVRERPYLSKILLLAEDLQSEEIVANCLKIFRIGITNDKYSDAVFNRFPNILNFMIFQMERWIGSSAVLGECVLSIRYTIEEGKNQTLLRPETIGAFVQHIRQNKQAMRDSNIQELLRITKNYQTNI